MKGIVGPSALVIDLDAQKHPTVISVVGAGGKTSLLFWLAELLQASGRHVLIMTTTYMFVPASHWPVASCRDPAMLPHASLASPISFCFHNWKADQGKVQGFTPGVIDVLMQRSEYDVISVEANGSRGMPLKAPDEHEPYIPKSNCYAIAAMGGHTLGAKMNTENIHHWPQPADITKLTPDVTLQLGDLVALVRHPQGTFKNVPQGCRRVWSISRFSQCGDAIV